MSARAIAAAVLTVALLGASRDGARVEAQVPERRRVAVDWSQVRDADVERCGLSRLRAGTIERLVDSGHAVVDRVDADGIRVSVASSSAGLRLQVASGEVVRDEMLAAGDGCDATFVLDAIERIAELVDAVERERPALEPAAPALAPPPTANERTPPPVTLEADAAQPEPRAPLQASFDLTARMSTTSNLTFGGGGAFRLRLPADFELGARIELTGNRALEVTILEGFAGITAAYQPALPGIGPYLELGPVLHSGASSARSATELDGELGAGVQASFGHLLAQLVLYVRLRSFEHRIGDETAFETSYFGVLLRIGAQLSDS